MWVGQHSLQIPRLERNLSTLPSYFNSMEAATVIFISHSWQDKPTARKVVDALATAGLPCWFDEQQLGPGTSLRVELKSAISKSDIFLYLVSDEANNSKWVQEELEFAVNLGDENIRIIPVRLVESDAGLPPLLSHKIYESLDPKFGGAARLAHRLAEMTGHDIIPEGCRLSATVRLEVHRLVHTLSQARDFPRSGNVDVLLLDDQYEALDLLYWTMSEQDFPLGAEGSPQMLANAAEIVAFIHKQSRSIIRETKLTCRRFISVNAKSDFQEYFDAGYERMTYLMLHRLQWNTTYLRALSGNEKLGEDFQRRRYLPEAFDGHKCDFVADDKILGSTCVPDYGHPFSADMKHIIPWGLNNPFHDMLPSIVGTAVGELLARRFMAQTMPSTKMPSPESLKYGLA